MTSSKHSLSIPSIVSLILLSASYISPSLALGSLPLLPFLARSGSTGATGSRSRDEGVRRRTAENSTTAYLNPNLSGGSMITIANDSWPTDTGEPLNIIISAKSDERIFVDSENDGGWLNYMLSTELATECLGEHFGTAQTANLGTGNGYVDEVQELRWDYGDQYLGSCEETFDGGLHLRYWYQNETGAIFLAVSYEEDLADGHNIVYDGYNLGRDWLVGNVTGLSEPIKAHSVTNQTTYSGNSTFNNYTYHTDVVYVSGLLANSGVGINHNYSVGDDTWPAIDGLVAVLTVQIVSQSSSATLLQAGVVSLVLATASSAILLVV